ncbi:MAG: cell division protein FtsZ [Clostridiaceae bacterium]|nr:cell division protein FtsZ [Clostridiaceae bacterium]
MHVKPEVENFAKIKVLGIGGAGGNVINSMIESGQITGVEFIAVNTDAQDLSVNKAVMKLPIGQEMTHGLGSGANPEVGRKAAEESADIIKEHVEGADMVFITAGMGGGTGTGASPVIARIAKEAGALTIGVVTKPFAFEGALRMKNSEVGIAELREEVDALITIPNQRLLEVADENTSIVEAFKLSDSVLNQGVQGISDLIVMPGLINVDFADVKTIMKDAGTALMGIGIGAGEDRAEVAAKAAISSPLLEQSVEDAKGILFNVIGGSDLTMKEVDKAANIIRNIANDDANIIFGTTVDQRLSGQVKITVIATGFDIKQEDLGFNFVEKPVVRHPIPREEGGVSIDNDEPKANPSEKPKDLFKPEDFEGDFENKYDIPAFLRGK